MPRKPGAAPRAVPAIATVLAFLLLLAGCANPAASIREPSLTSLLQWSTSQEIVQAATVSAVAVEDEFGSKQELLLVVKETVTGFELEEFLNSFAERSESILAGIDDIRATVRVGNYSIVSYPLIVNRTMQLLRWLRDDPRVISGDVVHTRAVGVVAGSDPFTFASELHQGMSAAGGMTLEATITTKDGLVGLTMRSDTMFPEAEIVALQEFRATHPDVGGIVTAHEGHTVTTIIAPTTISVVPLREAITAHFERVTLRWGFVEGEITSFGDSNLPLVRAVGALPGLDQVHVIGDRLVVFLDGDANEATAQSVADAVVATGMRDTVDVEVRIADGSREGTYIAGAKQGSASFTANNTIGAAFAENWS